MSSHWPQVARQTGRWGHPLPGFVHREFESYLKCGILDHGFARIHCHGCGQDRLLGLGSTRQALPGSVLAVQRFGSSLNLNIHFHALVLDGVYVRDAFGVPAFFELPPPTLHDLNQVIARIAGSVLALLERKGVWMEDSGDDPVAERSPSLAALAKSAIRGTLVFGPAGSKPVCLKTSPIREVAQVERAGKALGFTLDAEVRVSAHNRLHRERLCRYLLRPPLAKGRLHETTDGNFALELKTPWSDGTRVIFFPGEELVARLAALVPPPRMHLVHYFGILAPNAKLRRHVVPELPEHEDADPCGYRMVYEEKRSGPSVRRRWIPWRTLLLRVFGVDVMKCPGCGSQMQRIAVILQSKVIRSILDCVRAKGRPP